ncbi:hypothetical protein WJX81_002214 [Elliptochloris bilobata]|uniref:WW domain-containing protein n=1 Tax=Elliptochloris bilobata TaxID=381761 RepID=A0AAW1SHQ4_9CHLO
MPPGTVVDPSEPWFCYQNPDVTRNSCDAPEESYNEDLEGVEAAALEEAGVLAAPQPPAGRGSARGAAGRARGRARARARGGGRTRPARTWQDGGGAGPLMGAKQRHGGGDEAQPGVKRQRSGSPARQSGRMSPPPPVRHASGVAGQQRWGAAAPARARGTVKVRKAHAGFVKLLASTGLWEVAKGRGRAVIAPPHYVWEGLAQFAPEAAELACRAADAASAAQYFVGQDAAPGGREAADAAVTARAALTAAAAIAASGAVRVPGAFDLPEEAGTPKAAALARPHAAAVHAVTEVVSNGSLS